MKRRIQHAEPRAIAARTILAMLRRTAHVYLETTEIGTNAPELVLCLAIFIGQAEGKPMTSTKLATYIGMPRPTVIRKLRTLAKAGLIEMKNGKACLPHEKLNSERVLDMRRRSAREARTLASNLDASIVDR